jgi:hypothetical protein
MLNPKYKDYHYGMWLVNINDKTPPVVIEGNYVLAVEEAKKMEGFGDETTIERVEYKRLGRRNLDINEIWIRQHELCPNGVIGIEWSGAPGFGRYELILGDDGKLHAMTEHMDIPTQKMFSRDILNAILRDIVIEE